MTSLEQALMDAFAGLADEAPHELGLLSRVQVATTRRTRVRRLSYLVSALAAVTAIAVGIALLPAGGAKADRFSDPTGFLVDNRAAQQVFPMTPTYLPLGMTTTPRLDIYATHGEARYLFGGPMVTITYAEHYGPTRLSNETTVKGIQAFQQCSASLCALEWYRHPTQHVEIAAYLSVEELRRIAEGLTDVPTVVRPTIVLGLLPAGGCHLNAPLESSTSYHPVDSGRTGGSSLSCPVSASVLPRGETAGTYGPQALTVVARRARIGGYRGTLSAISNSVGRTIWQADLALPDGRTLVVVTPADHGWDRDELDRFVRAIVLP